MEWIASTLHTTLEHGVSSITTADAHTSAASSRLNWSPRRFKWTLPFSWKTKSGFCACAIAFQLAFNSVATSWNGLLEGSVLCSQLSTHNRQVTFYWSCRTLGKNIPDKYNL